MVGFLKCITVNGNRYHYTWSNGSM